jgi:hypothetical protein
MTPTVNQNDKNRGRSELLKGTRLSRYLGDATHLSAKEWSSETASGWPAFSCPAGCGYISEINPTEITATGIVLRRRVCGNEGCGWMDYLEFESFDAKDVGR